MLRVILDIFALIFVFLFPPYITAIFLFVLTFFFTDFLEGVIFAYLIDRIYGSGNIFGFNFPFVFTIIFLILFLISLKLKTVLKFYSRE
ncbi:MAG: hypothetical protein WC631_01495 [Candidatus Paceibacterota bacterium]|jgi:hypothetical protein